MNDQIDKLFGGRVRVRACGLCWQDNKLLLIDHKGITGGHFWAPPGGGVDFGNTIQDTLMNEFKDETGLTIKIGEFRFIGEFIHEPLHAVELYFDVTRIAGHLNLGFDPEMAESDQILADLRFMTFEEILDLPDHERHGMFRLFQTEKALKNASGYHKI